MRHASEPPPPSRLPVGEPLLRPPAPPVTMPYQHRDERLAALSRRQAERISAGAGSAHGADARIAGAGSERTPPQAGRRHAAAGTRAAALAVGVGTTMSLATYMQRSAALAARATVAPAPIQTAATTATQASTAETAVPPAAATTSAETPATAEMPTTTAVTSTQPAPVGESSPTGLTDGVYAGDTDVNRWGPVQVQVTVSGGQVTDVAILQYPDADRKSVSINRRALPTLVSETLSVQSALVDTVSGATYTSDSYRDSLQSALDLAGV